jgi:hypothetical protein
MKKLILLSLVVSVFPVCNGFASTMDVQNSSSAFGGRTGIEVKPTMSAANCEFQEAKRKVSLQAGKDAVRSQSNSESSGKAKAGSAQF